MKKLLVVMIMSSFLLSGCSIFKDTPFEGTFLDNIFSAVDKKYINKEPKKPEKLIEEYCLALKNKKYKKAAKFYPKKAWERMTEELAKGPFDYNEFKVVDVVTQDNGAVEVNFTLDDQLFIATFEQQDDEWILFGVGAEDFM